MDHLVSRVGSFDERHYYEGIKRVETKDGFEYFYIDTRKPASNKDVVRIEKLRIPPAWTKVWISQDPTADIQAIGTDNKGRKQYRYHQKHIEKAEQMKFLVLYDFIKAIPKLEKVMLLHSKHGPYSKERVIVTMLTIIKELHMRVGKEVYARENKSYGVSSLKKIHMKFDGDTIMFRFKGKSNQRLFYSLNDKILKDHLRLLLKLEGDKLFQYIDADDQIKKVTDTDLNRYIQEHMGPEYTVKLFRTYGANHYFIKALLKETKNRSPKTQIAIKKNIMKAVESTAFYLRHTKAVSKKSYVMNFAIDMYTNDPEYFIDRKNDDPDAVLLSLLRMYKKHIINL